MGERRKLIEAVRLISSYCKKWQDDHNACEGCIFCHGEGSSVDCLFCDQGEERTPNDWEIGKIRRFTDRDRTFAEALKLFDFNVVERGVNRIFCESIAIDNRGIRTDRVVLPTQAFEDIESGESLDIDEIINDGKK